MGEGEEEEVQSLRQVPGVVESLREPPRMCRVEDGEPVDHLGVVHRNGPGDRPAPVVTDQERRLLTELSDEAPDSVGEQVAAVVLEIFCLRQQFLTTRFAASTPK